MNIALLIIIVVAIVVRIVLHFVIKRVVERVVNGVKKRQRVDDTQALASSPVTAVRTVQRARTLGDVLGGDEGERAHDVRVDRRDD